MQRRYSVIATLIVIFLSAPACAGLPPGFSGWRDDDGRVDIGPALQLPLNTTPPVICSTDTQGTLALNDRAQMCLCAGERWKLVNSDEPCPWHPAGQ